MRRGVHVPALPPEVVLQVRHTANLACLPCCVLREAGTGYSESLLGVNIVSCTITLDGFAVAWPQLIMCWQDVLRDLFQAPLLPAAFSTGFPSAATQPGTPLPCLPVIGMAALSMHSASYH